MGPYVDHEKRTKGGMNDIGSIVEDDKGDIPRGGIFLYLILNFDVNFGADTLSLASGRTLHKSPEPDCHLLSEGTSDPPNHGVNGSTRIPCTNRIHAVVMQRKGASPAASRQEHEFALTLS